MKPVDLGLTALPCIPPGGFKVGQLVEVIDRRDWAIVDRDVIEAIDPEGIVSFKCLIYRCHQQCLRLAPPQS